MSSAKASQEFFKPAIDDLKRLSNKPSVKQLKKCNQSKHKLLSSTLFFRTTQTLYATLLAGNDVKQCYSANERGQLAEASFFIPATRAYSTKLVKTST